MSRSLPPDAGRIDFKRFMSSLTPLSSALGRLILADLGLVLRSASLLWRWLLLFTILKVIALLCSLSRSTGKTVDRCSTASYDGYKCGHQYLYCSVRRLAFFLFPLAPGDCYYCRLVVYAIWRFCSLSSLLSLSHASRASARAALGEGALSKSRHANCSRLCDFATPTRTWARTGGEAGGAKENKKAVLRCESAQTGRRLHTWVADNRPEKRSLS